MRKTIQDIQLLQQADLLHFGIILVNLMFHNHRLLILDVEKEGCLNTGVSIDLRM